MIRNSFVLLDKVGLKKEQSIWNQGVTEWNDFLSTNQIKGISKNKKEKFNEKISQAKKELFKENSEYFANEIPFSEQWRLYNEFKDQALFLDIETNGYHGSITVIGLYDGIETKTMIRGYNLDKSLLENELKKYKLLITFNGASFDVPVIKRFFGININIPHVDLRFLCQRIGLRGGLKQIEKDLGIQRCKEVQEITGADSVYLWNNWQSLKKKEYLDLLIKYNEEDIVNLKPLAEFAVKEMKSRILFKTKI